MKLEVYIALYDLEVVNGCGQKIKNFDKLLDDISSLIEYDDDKGESLAQRLRLEACGPHDMDYHDGGTWLDRWIADILIIIRIYRLLDWTSFLVRYWLVIPGLIGIYRELRIQGKSSFNFRTKSILSKSQHLSQIPSLALAGVFGAGACGCKMRWSNTLTANGGSNTSLTTTATISGLANGKKVRFLTGSNAGKETLVTGVKINPGGTSSLYFADIGAAVENTDTFIVETGLFMVLSAYATLASGVVKSYDPLTGVTTSLGTTNLPAAWGTDGRMVVTTSDDIFESGTATGGGVSLLTHTGKAWTVNQWTNYQVRIVSGTGSGQTPRTVASNTANGLVPSVAWTTAPDGTSVYEITGNDDFVYLLGNNNVAVYKYSRSGNKWAVMAPTTARAAAPGSGMSANWAGKTGDTVWADVTDIKDGRYIYSFRGGGSSALDRLDLAGGTAGAGAWAAIAYINQAETFTTGSSFGCNGRYIYCRKDATHRYFKYSMRGNYMEPLTTNLYADGAALVGDKTWIWNYQEAGVTKLSYLYSLRNTGTELHRMALI